MGGRGSKCRRTARRKAACLAKEERARAKARDAADGAALAAAVYAAGAANAQHGTASVPSRQQAEARETARAIACALACGKLVTVLVDGENRPAVLTTVSGLEVCVVIGSSQTQAGASCMCCDKPVAKSYREKCFTKYGTYPNTCYRCHQAERTAATATGPQEVGDSARPGAPAATPSFVGGSEPAAMQPMAPPVVELPPVGGSVGPRRRGRCGRRPSRGSICRGGSGCPTWDSKCFIAPASGGVDIGGIQCCRRGRGCRRGRQRFNTESWSPRSDRGPRGGVEPCGF